MLCVSCNVSLQADIRLKSYVRHEHLFKQGMRMARNFGNAFQAFRLIFSRENIDIFITSYLWRLTYVPKEVIRKKLRKMRIFFGTLKATEENSRIRSRIRIRNPVVRNRGSGSVSETLRIRNTVVKIWSNPVFYPLFPSLSSSMPPSFCNCSSL